MLAAAAAAAARFPGLFSRVRYLEFLGLFSRARYPELPGWPAGRCSRSAAHNMSHADLSHVDMSHDDTSHDGMSHDRMCHVAVAADSGWVQGEAQDRERLALHSATPRLRSSSRLQEFLG